MTASLTQARGVRTARDVRGYWRTTLALSAPLGWVTVGVSNALMPYPLDGTVAENIAGIDAHRETMTALGAVYPLFVFTFVPGVIALTVACRRRTPLFAAVLGTFGVLGALAGTANPPLDLFILKGLQQGLDPSALAGVVNAMDSTAVTWPLVFTLLFITLGRIATGVLLWKASVGPRALAVLMALTPFVEFGGFALGWGNFAPALAWTLSGVAMVGVSIELLRMPNAEFDLPPVPS